MAGMQHVFLSPHFDDAALSCGGTMAQLGRLGAPVVVATIFGGKPDYGQLSPFAQSIHARPLAGADPIDLRVAEEREALAILHAHSHLYPYLDCIYRRDLAEGRWLYDSEGALFGPLDRADDTLVADLSRTLARLAPSAELCRFYAPLAIGSHVDHQLVRQAAFRLLEAGHDVRFYEDYPYVIRTPAGLMDALAQWGDPTGWHAEVMALEEMDLALKIAAVCAYRSQLGVLFGTAGNGSEHDVAPALLSFGRQVANAGGVSPYGERLWRWRHLS
jgi:LmbE family N-acetylglucosaminyl deacetylase